MRQADDDPIAANYDAARPATAANLDRWLRLIAAAFEEGLAALRAYAVEHPGDPWLREDTLRLTLGRKP